MRRPRLYVSMAAMALAASSLGACAAGHASLGTSSGTCYLALPTASAAVHGVGKLVGVRSFNAHDLVVALTRPAPRGAPSIIDPGSGSTVTSPPSTGTSEPKVHREARVVAHHLAVFGNSTVCAVEYEGRYPPGSVDYAVDPTVTGSYAFVVLPVKGGQPVVVFVVRRLPLKLKHFF